MEFSESTIAHLHSLYKKNPERLKELAIELLKQGYSHMEILQLTIKELNLGLNETITLLEFPDYME